MFEKASLMNRLIPLSVAVILMAILLLAASCGDSSRKGSVPDDVMNEYVAGHTSGTIDRNQEIIIKFSKPAVDADKTGHAAEKGVISFSPAVKGSASWNDPSTLLFIPDQEYDWSTSYTVNVDLKRLFGPQVKAKSLTFVVSTIDKNFSVDIRGLSLAGDDEKIYFLEGSMATSGTFIPDEAESVITAKQEGKSLTVEWEHSPQQHTHTFFVRGIERGEKESEVEVKWNGKKIGVESSGSKKVPVPSVSDFKITSWRVETSPSRYLAIEFSDNIDEGAELTGMVMIQGESVSRVTRNGNILSVFTSAALTGSHKVTVDGALSNRLGYSLGDDVTFTAEFGGVKPGVRLTGEGVIVPASDGLIFPFEAAGLTAVDLRITKIFSDNIHFFLHDNDLDGSYDLRYFGRMISRAKIDLKQPDRVIDYGKWNAFSVDLSDYVDVEPGAIYRVEIGFRKSYSTYSCDTGSDTDLYYSPVEEEGKLPSTEYDQVFYNRYYNWREGDDPCSQAYYSPDRFVTRNILASNLGIIAKRDASGEMNVVVTGLKSGRPEADVQVDAFDLQNQKLVSVRTDKDGFASFKPERTPFLITAKKSGDVGYLKTSDGKSLSLSNFDVSGRSSETGTKGFIYGERGVWRPGDSVYVAFILEDRQEWLPAGHPIVFELYDPKGQMVKRLNSVVTNRMIYPFWFNTREDDPTGNWTASVRVGATQFTKRIRIETVKPNRLKINLEFRNGVIIGGETVTGALNARWLHGAPASGMRAVIDVSYSRISTAFEKYQGYQFDAPFGEPYIPESELFDASLDDKGDAAVSFRFTANEEVNSMLRATFVTRVFEPGGDFSINRSVRDISPFKRYVGFKVPWSDPKYQRVNTDEEHIFPVVTVSATGEPVDAKGITVKVFRLEWRYWWSRSDENLANYSGRTYHKPVFTTTIATKNGKGDFSLSVPKDKWGRYLLLVTLPDGNVAGKVVFFDWPWGRSESAGGAEILAVSTDRESYNVGDDITVSFPSGESSSALVSIENGSKVLRQEWIEVTGTTTTWKLKATPEMAPNIYVHISLINPYHETANDLPVRMYGIAPVMVEDPSSHLKPVITMPDKLKPESAFTVKVSESAGRPMEYTLAVVDEGLLDLTGFKTPDPWINFYSREALGVKTWDLYRYVLGAWGGELEKMFAIGGDESALDPSQKKEKRFEPVVRVLGPFTLEKGKSNQHTLNLPQYVGSVRTMVVAAGKNAYGNASKSVPVSNPVMVLGTVPRVLAPGERIKLPVSLFVMEEGIKSVTVEVETNDMLNSVGESSRVMKVDATGEYDLEFEYVVAGNTGFAKIDITASAGSEKGRHTVNVEVRNPNPPETRAEMRKLEPGESWKVEMDAFGTRGTNSGRIEVSSLLPMNMEKRLRFLTGYPHGCLEQVTSGAFPQLYLSDLMKLENEEREEIKANILSVIGRLRGYQLADGSMSFWPGGGRGSEWGTIYATHFILEAEKKGYGVPSGVKSRLTGWIKGYANSYRFSATRPYDQVTQAYALYVLSLAGEPAQGAMNRLRERKDDLQFLSRWYLAGAYAMAGRAEAASSLVDMRQLDPSESYPAIYGSVDRDLAVVLNVLNLLGREEEGYSVAKKLSESLSSGKWMSTQTTAWSLISLSQFFGDFNPESAMTYRLEVNGKGSEYASDQFLSVHPVDNDRDGGAMSEVVNNSSFPLYVVASWSGQPESTGSEAVSRGIDMSATYRDRAGKSIDPASVMQGSDFVVEVKVVNRGMTNVSDLALTQIFPSGWEIVNTRLFEGAAKEKNSSYEYRDIRDDRVYTYFDLGAGATALFTINITAAYQGEFVLPSFVCSGMYDNSFYTSTTGMKVEVKR